MSVVSRYLRKDSSGAAAMEFALVAPIVFAVLFGFAQVGLAFFAKAGIEHGVETGARYASIYPRPTDAQIAAKVLAHVYGTSANGLSQPIITHGISRNVPYAEISLTYQYTLDLGFVAFGPVTLSHRRRVYQV